MKVTLLSVYVGPNIYGPSKAISGKLELGVLEQHTSVTLGEAFRTGLSRLLPGLGKHKENNKPFTGQLQTGLHPVQVLVHMITALQSLTGYKTEFTRVLAARTPGNYKIVIAYREKDVAIMAAQVATTLFCYLLPEELRPANSVAPGFNPGNAIKSYLERAGSMALMEPSLTLARVAELRDIPWRRLHPDAHIIELGQGCYRQRFCLTVTDNTGQVAGMLSNNKSYTNKLLHDAGLPAPAQGHARLDSSALETAKQIGYPVVVKPPTTDQGVGISVGVMDQVELQHALQKVARFGSTVLIEQYIPGDDHRLLVIDNRLVAAAKRLPPKITGNGSDTVEQLLAVFNAEPNRGPGHSTLLTSVELDAEALALLAARGHDAKSIPAAGEQLVLRGTANLSTGGSAVDCINIIHPDNRRMAERAARCIGLDIAGVDFITTDISRSWKEIGGGICEVNQTPGLRPHWHADNILDVHNAIIDSMYPPGSPSRIPVAAITGTSGKTTTCRMVARILETAGLTTGLATTDGVSIAGEEIVHRDDAGPRGAQMVLSNPEVEAAVLETARGALANWGFGPGECTVGAVMNITPDHLGFDGIRTLDDLAQIKQLVVQTARDMAVLNADDVHCIAMADHTSAKRICYVTTNPANELVTRHTGSGSCAVILDTEKPGQPIRLLDQGKDQAILDATAIPAALGGKAEHNISNALFATAIAYGMGISIDSIRKGLLDFTCSFEENPGRTNFYHEHPFTVVVDYAHNPDKILALGKTVNAISGKGRRIGVICSPGNRTNQHFEDFTRVAAGHFDYFICSRSDYLRGRGPMEPQELLRAGLLKQGIDENCIEIAKDEPDAVSHGLEYAQPGDVLAICCMDPQRTWNQVVTYKPATGHSS